MTQKAVKHRQLAKGRRESEEGKTIQIDWLSAIPPMQVSEVDPTEPTMNVSGEIAKSFPPKLMLILGRFLHGTVL